MSATTKDLVKKFIKLDQSIKKKEGEIDKLKEERRPLEEELMRRFQDGGIASMKSNAGVTVYVRRDLWAGAINEGKEALYAAMKTVDGVKEMVKETVNVQTFSAWVREKIDRHFGEDAKKKPVEELKSALPVELQPVVNLSERFSLRTRKG
jgi:hypothetical protein